MTEQTPVDEQTGNQNASWTKRFRKHARPAAPEPEQLRRQDSVLQCAWRSLGTSGSVIEFLNTPNQQLGRAPLHLAIESDDGLLRVQVLLEEIALKATDRMS